MKYLNFVNITSYTCTVLPGKPLLQIHQVPEPLIIKCDEVYINEFVRSSSVSSEKKKKRS